MKKILFRTFLACCVGTALIMLSGCGCGCGCKCCSHDNSTTYADKKCCSSGCTCCKDHKAVKGQKMSDETIKRSETGLGSVVVKEGTGTNPTRGQMVVVHYTGWLDEDGQPGRKFDSSKDRGQPFEFMLDVGQVIKGWDEGVKGMKKGGHYRLYIPADLGYGARGAGGGIIPPNADLIFDVELIDIR